MTLGYKEYPQHGYPWTDYVTIEDLQEVYGNEFTPFIQVTKNYRDAKI